MINFVGAGPGDPELLTLKGYRLLQEADLVVYAGSLVNEALLNYAKPGACLVNSANLNLDEIITLMVEAYNNKKNIVRLHTGDPSLYGAIGEQMDKLEQMGIPYSVIPGVSSFLAAAACLSREYTVPDGTQTVIITRLEGRTPVPEKENLSLLASHQSSMAIFLSVSMIDRVVEELVTAYPPDTPAVVVEKASWPEERIIRARLDNIARAVKEAGINKTALILVGEFLRDSGESRLYAKDFKHAFRA